MGPMEIVARTVGNAAGLWLATRLLSGLSVPEGVGTSRMWLNLLVLGLVLALVNSLIKPVAKFLTFPLYIITFGLFALVVNGAMLSLTGWLTDHIAALGAGGSVPLGLEVASFGSAVAGSIIVSVISSILFLITLGMIYGATGTESWDCSGLTMGAWGQAGVSLPHSSSASKATASTCPAVRSA